MENTENTSQAMHLLAEAHRAWERMRPLREKRLKQNFRCMDFSKSVKFAA